MGGGRRSGGSEGGDLVGAHAPDGREIVVDLLGRVGKAAELIQLEGEGGQGAVVGQFEGMAAFVETGLELIGEVGEELLGQGSGPRGNGIGGG